MTRPGPWLVLDASLGAGTAALIDVAGTPRLLAAVAAVERDALFADGLRMLEAEGCPLDALGACVVGDGPGSFTALRIVGAMGKGLAEGTGMPLHAVPTLALLVASTAATTRGGRWLAALDALRGESYAALIETDDAGAVRSVASLGRLPQARLGAEAEAAGAQWVGPGAPITAVPEARGAVRCIEWIRAAGPVDLGTWEPTYGRLAEALAQWEATYGRPLGS